MIYDMRSTWTEISGPHKPCQECRPYAYLFGEVDDEVADPMTGYLVDFVLGGECWGGDECGDGGDDCQCVFAFHICDGLTLPSIPLAAWRRNNR